MAHVLPVVEYHEFIPIPPVFWSFETGQPFQSCSFCNGSLQANGTNYLIEKAYKGPEPLWEYALCLDCHDAYLKTWSNESRRRVGHYFDEHVNVDERRSSCLAAHGMNPDPWMAECIIKRTPRSATEEYLLLAHCIDRDMVFTHMPCLVSERAVEEMVDLISPETRGALDAFADRLFGIGLPRGVLVL